MPFQAIETVPIFPVWLTLALAFVTFLIGVTTARKIWDNAPFDVTRGWRLAWVYFAACFALSFALGVLPALISAPASAQQFAEVRWWFGLLGVLGVVIVAYGFVWPIGTETHRRPLDLPAVLGFGVLWGLSEGQLFLCIWVMFQLLLPEGWLVPSASFVAIASFSAVWHSQFWDRYVVPEHNDPAWNFRKILFVHVPSLAVTLSFLAVTGNALIFVLLQTVALVLSSLAMRLQRWSPKTPV